MECINSRNASIYSLQASGPGNTTIQWENFKLIFVFFLFNIKKLHFNMQSLGCNTRGTLRWSVIMMLSSDRLRAGSNGE